MLPHPNSVPMCSIYLMEYILLLDVLFFSSGVIALVLKIISSISPEFPFLLTTYIHFRARL